MAILTQREGVGWTCTLVLFDVARTETGRDAEPAIDSPSEEDAPVSEKLQGLLEEWQKY
jgi:hypothetical protein